MDSPRWRLILNGKSAGNDALRAAVVHWRERGVRVDVRVTWESGDAGRYVDEAVADAVDTIVAGGGDGTLSEIAAALAHREETAEALPALALIPMGTANDFATAAGIPTAPDEALGLAAEAAAIAIDLLRVEADDGPHWCINLASGGFGTEVTVETDEKLKKMLGGLAYVITGIARLGRIEPVAADLRGPDFAWSGGFLALGLGNGRQAGGGQVLCPDAWINDGQIDLTVLPVLNGDLATVGTLLTRRDSEALERLTRRARLPALELSAAKPFTLNLDGEPVRSRHFRVTCVPGRLRMHLPPDCPLLVQD
ncbi:lipid kinase YegS [Pseudoxanthomonas beigongshangi]